MSNRLLYFGVLCSLLLLSSFSASFDYNDVKSNEEQIDNAQTLLKILIKADDYWIRSDDVGYPIGFDTESATEMLTITELQIISILYQNLKTIYNTASVGETILGLDLKRGIWDDFYSVVQKYGLSYLVNIADIGDSNEGNSESGISLSHSDGCKWWEACACNGNYDHPHPTYQYNFVKEYFGGGIYIDRSWSTFDSAADYLIDSGFHLTAEYASGYNQESDHTKVIDAPTGYTDNTHPCNSGPFRKHGYVWTGHESFDEYHVWTQTDLNPEVISWWIGFMPGYWADYVEWWHVNVDDCSNINTCSNLDHSH